MRPEPVEELGSCGYGRSRFVGVRRQNAETRGVRETAPLFCVMPGLGLGEEGSGCSVRERNRMCEV